MSKINVLVTGAKGQLGSELQLLIKDNCCDNCNFIFTDVDTLDITERSNAVKFVEQNPVDFIINCAAYTAVDKAEEDKDKAFLINTTAIDYLISASVVANACLVHISTDYVFDGTQNTPYHEDNPTFPETMYGKTKDEGEKLILEADINAFIIRTSWLYSSFGNNFVKTMIRLGEEKDEINVVYDQIGTPTYARDLASTILDIVKQFKPEKEYKKQEIYHYTNEGVASWYDFACEIFRIRDIKCNINPVDSKQFKTLAKRPAFSVLNKSKIKTDFNIKINHWADSLRDMLDVLGK